MPRLVNSWMVVAKAPYAWAVGPPWLVTMSGGRSPSGAPTSGFVGR